MERTPDGVVRVDAGSVGAWSLVPAASGAWAVVGPGDGQVGTLRASGNGAGGFVLVNGDGVDAERARSTPLAGAGPGPGESDVVLADGRVFRVVPRTAGAVQVAIEGWETAGAYFEGTRERDGWVFRATVAGNALGTDPMLMILVAAQLVVDAERE